MTQAEKMIEMEGKDETSQDLVEKPESSNKNNDENLFLGLIGHVKINNTLIKESIAELFGTFILVLIGCSSVAQFKLSTRDDPKASNFLSVNLGFGLGVMISILLVGKISGAHLNPAVSLAMFLTNRLNLLKFLLYSAAQTFGAFLGAAVVFLIYLDGINSFGINKFSLETAGIFATYPNKGIGLLVCSFDQVIGTAILIFAVLAITDKKHMTIPQEKCAVLVGLVLVVIGCSFGYNCGYAINPARDFGPRFFTLIAGWGSQVFTGGNYFFWIPLIAPMLGSLIATVLYYAIVSNNF